MNRTSKIAALNDQLRERIGIPAFGTPSVPGTIFCTPGIDALPPETLIAVLFAVRDFADFTLDNDPYGEHDFGVVDLPETPKVFWKIDYCADDTLTHGSEDPSDPAKSFRVLTIMLASEY